MATITTGEFAKLVWPGLNSIYGKAYADWTPEWSQLFTKYGSNQNYEEDLGITSFGLASVKAEGAPITYDSERQGFVTRYKHITYATGFIITREMIKDDRYNQVGNRGARGLAKAIHQTRETVGANIFNRAFNSAYTWGDGKEMCATDHVNVAGGTWSNELTTAADLSEASLEQALIDISGFTDDRGLKAAVRAQGLCLPYQLEFEAERILNSPLRVGTSDNDLNALRSTGKFPQGVMLSHYFTDTDAWFIKTDAQDGLKYFEREADVFEQDNDFDTDNAKFKSYSRYSFGITDVRAIFGSPGA